MGDINEIMDESCTDAGIKDFIMKKQDKYDYMVGIRGMNYYQDKDKKYQ